MQSRANRVRDVLSREEVNDVADAPAGAVRDVLRDVSRGVVGSRKSEAERMGVQGGLSSAAPEGGQQNVTKVSVAQVGRDGKVTTEAGGPSNAAKASV